MSERYYGDIDEIKEVDKWGVVNDHLKNGWELLPIKQRSLTETSIKDDKTTILKQSIDIVYILGLRKVRLVVSNTPKETVADMGNETVPSIDKTEEDPVVILQELKWNKNKDKESWYIVPDKVPHPVKEFLKLKDGRYNDGQYDYVISPDRKDPTKVWLNRNPQRQ